MSIFDFILILFLGAFVWSGFRAGLIRSLGSVLGFFAGVWAAVYYYERLAGWIGFLFFGHDSLARFVCFVLILALAMRFFSFFLNLIDGIFNIIAIIPFLKTFNRLLGAIFGFIEGSFIIGLALYGISSYLAGNFLGELAASSGIASLLSQAFGWLAPLLPDAGKYLGGAI